MRKPMLEVCHELAVVRTKLPSFVTTTLNGEGVVLILTDEGEMSPVKDQNGDLTKVFRTGSVPYSSQAVPETPGPPTVAVPVGVTEFV
jgi:hypothetical protein